MSSFLLVERRRDEHMRCEGPGNDLRQCATNRITKPKRETKSCKEPLAGHPLLCLDEYTIIKPFTARPYKKSLIYHRMHRLYDTHLDPVIGQTLKIL